MGDDVFTSPEAAPSTRFAYTIAGDDDRGWIMHAAGLTFEEALAVSSLLGAMMRDRKKAKREAAERARVLAVQHATDSRGGRDDA